jgi:ABC-type branched-subunit amino acid transport system substrate-binding protein
VPFFAPFTGAMSLREPFNRMAFHLRASYNDETELIVRQLTNLGLKRIAVFHQNDAYGRAGLDGTVLALSKRSLTPVATATVERNSVDVAQAVTTINAARPDAVVQISAYASCAAYLVDGAENALAVAALHLDADGVAELHETRSWAGRPEWFRWRAFRQCSCSPWASPCGRPPRPPGLLTVPLPTMEPARTRRVLAMWAMSWPK